MSDRYAERAYPMDESRGLRPPFAIRQPYGRACRDDLLAIWGKGVRSGQRGGRCWILPGPEGRSPRPVKVRAWGGAFDGGATPMMDTPVTESDHGYGTTERQTGDGTTTVCLRCGGQLWLPCLWVNPNPVSNQRPR